MMASTIDGQSSYSELLVAAEAFYCSLLGKENYKRWSVLKKKNDFNSESEFVSWMLDIVETYIDQPSDLSIPGYEDVMRKVDSNTDSNQNQLLIVPQDVLPLPSLQDKQFKTNVFHNADVSSLDSPFTNYSNKPSSDSSYSDTADITVDLDESCYEEDNAQGNLECRVCNKVARSGLELLDHINEQHSDLSLEERDAISHSYLECNIRCIFCGKVFTSKPNMLQHIKASHLNWKCKCDECDKEFTSVRNLSRHKVTVHLGIRNFPCSFCKVAFKRSHHLARHMQKHVKFQLTAANDKLHPAEQSTGSTRLK